MPILTICKKGPALARQSGCLTDISLFCAALFLVLSATPLRTIAQEFPARSIRLIVPFPPGGSTDIFARMFGQKLSENIRQPVEIDNRAGGGTLIASDALIKSPADGYTLMLSSVTTFSVNQSLYEKLPYDPFTDFAPVSLTGRFPLVLVVGKDIPARSIRELLALVKTRPQEFHFGSPGPASVHRLAMEMLSFRAGVELVHVPYKGSNPAMQDLLGGRIAMMFVGVDSGAEVIRSGRVRALGIGTAERFAGMPDVPAIAESGLPGFEASAWQGMVAPARTPAPVVQKLNAEIARVLGDAAIRQKLLAAGIEPLRSTPEEFAAYMRTEAVKWAEVVRRAKVSAD